MLQILGDVSPNARNQRRAHQRLIRRDRIGHADVASQIESEHSRAFLADEGVVIDLIESEACEELADFVLELAKVTDAEVTPEELARDPDEKPKETASAQPAPGESAPESPEA